MWEKTEHFRPKIDSTKKRRVWKVHFGHFFGGFLFCFGVCQRPKQCNLDCFGASFAWNTYLLQPAESCVNSNVFARRWPKNTIMPLFLLPRSKNIVNNYRGFGFPRSKKHWSLQCFSPRVKIT